VQLVEVQVKAALGSVLELEEQVWALVGQV
jgi:hypothetical protein